MTDRDQALAVADKLRDAAKTLRESGNASDAKRCELAAHNICHEEDMTLDEAQIIYRTALRQRPDSAQI